MSDILHSIFGAEIFATGIHNGDKYTEKDLDDMVDAAPKVGFRPPLKAGHAEKPGDPALGWVQNIRREGSKLLADFLDIPDEIYKVIKRHGWDTVSSEVFWNLDRDGKVYRRVLKAVALLGIEIPAVPNLKPLRDVAFSGENATVKSYEYKPEKENPEMDKQIEELTSKVASLTAQLSEEKKNSAAATDQKILALKTELDAAKNALAEEQKKAQKKIFELEEAQRQDRIFSKVKGIKIPSLRKYFLVLYQAATTETKTVKFSQKDGEAEKDTAIEEVVDALVAVINQKAERLFGEKGGSKQEERQSGAENLDDPGQEVDRRTKEYMEKNQVKDYKAAMHKVLDADPELKELYVSAQ